MSMCRVISCVVGRGCLLWPMGFFWQNSMKLCPSSFCTPRPNLPVTPGISWPPTFAFQSPIMKMTLFCGVSSRRLQAFIELFNFSFFSITGRGIGLDYCDIEWFALETDIILSFLRLHPLLHFEIFCWPWWLLHFFWGIPAHSSRYSGHLKFTYSSPV